MNTNQDFSDIKAGQYVKVQYRSEKPYVQKVSKVTKTQIVISEYGYGDEPNTDRYRVSNGCRLGDSWYTMRQIIRDPVSEEEISAYEARIAENERIRKERKRLEGMADQAKARLISLFGGHIADENIKIQSSSNDGLKTWAFEIKCEKVSEEALTAALGL